MLHIFSMIKPEDTDLPSYEPVSYTHLDVYKRQGQHNRAAAAGDGSTIDCGCGLLCAISFADFCFRFSRYNIRIAFKMCIRDRVSAAAVSCSAITR